MMMMLTNTRVRSLICPLDVSDQQTFRVQLETFRELWHDVSMKGYMATFVMMAAVSLGITPVSPVRNICMGHQAWQ